MGVDAGIGPTLVVVTSGLVPFAFGIYEMRIGRASDSPSLIADAREFQAHVLSSGLDLAALVGQWSGLQLDRPAALLIVVWIVRAAWHTLVDAIRVLLDASLDRDTLETAEQIIRRVPGVVEVKGVSGRNAGRHRFIEAEVTLRTHVFERAHQISEEISEPIGSHPERRHLAASARRGRPPRPEVTLDKRFRSDPAPAACAACRGREGTRTPVTEARSSARMPPRKP